VRARLAPFRASAAKARTVADSMQRIADAESASATADDLAIACEAFVELARTAEAQLVESGDKASVAFLAALAAYHRLPAELQEAAPTPHGVHFVAGHFGSGGSPDAMPLACEALRRQRQEEK
jgi:hypothetical protein